MAGAFCVLQGLFGRRRRLKQDAGCVSDGPGTVVIGKTVAAADIRDKQTVTFHGGAGFFRKTAAFRKGAFAADAAAAAAQTQSMGMDIADLFADPMEMLQMLLFYPAVCPGVNGFFRDASGLQQNTPGLLPYFAATLLQSPAVRWASPVFSVSAAFVGSTHLTHIRSGCQCGNVQRDCLGETQGQGCADPVFHIKTSYFWQNSVEIPAKSQVPAHVRFLRSFGRWTVRRGRRRGVWHRCRPHCRWR